MQTKELIAKLRKAEGSETLRGVYLGQLNAEMICKKAADALEATLWRDDVENASKDGTDFLCLYGNQMSVCFWDEDDKSWKPLTPPEAE